MLDVDAGRHCRAARLAVDRHRRDVAAPPDGCEFDLDAGLRVCRWIESACTFTATRFAGQRFLLQPWQVFFVVSAFGWRRGDTRRFRRWHLWTPRKSGKSELAAAIGLYMLLQDGERQPFVCTTAASEKQARIIASAAWRMAGHLAEPTLHRNRMTERNPPVLEIASGQGTFKPLPRDIGGSLDGLSPSLAIIDELHSYRTSDTFDAMAEGQGARRRGALLVTSTAGDFDGIGREQHDLARAVLDGEVEQDDLLAAIHCAEPDDDWHDEAVWRRANPSIDVTVDIDFVRSRHREAVATGRESSFRRKQLNQWPPRERGNDVWIAEQAWDACSGSVGKARGRAWGAASSSPDGCATSLIWRRGGGWRIRIRLWATAREGFGWLVRQAARTHLQLAFDPLHHGPVDSVECVAVERSARHLSYPMRTLAHLVRDGAVTQRCPPAARADMVEVRLDERNGGLLPPRTNAPVSAAMAFALALADGGGTTMRDIPRWDLI